MYTSSSRNWIPQRLLLLVGLLVSAIMAQAADIYVDDDYTAIGANDGHTWNVDAFDSLQNAVAAANANDTIHIAAGTYIHTGQLNIDKTLTIQGAGADVVTILRDGSVGGTEHRAIELQAADITISDVTLAGWELDPNDANTGRGYLLWHGGGATGSTLQRILFQANDNRVAIYFRGADGMTVIGCTFRGAYLRGCLRGAAENILIRRNSFEETHYQDSAIQFDYGDPTSGEISYNYFNNGVGGLNNDIYGGFKSDGTLLYAIRLNTSAITADGLKIIHNTFVFEDAAETNEGGFYPEAIGIYSDPEVPVPGGSSLTVSDNIFTGYTDESGYTGPTWTPDAGVFDGALAFDGVNDFATFLSPGFNVGESGTFNVWIKLDPSATGKRNQIYEGPGDSGMELQYRSNGGGQFFTRVQDDGEYAIQNGGAASAGGVWTNVQVTWDATSGTARIYIDGTEVTYLAGFDSSISNFDAVTFTDTVSGLMHIGQDPGDGGRFFHGLMDDIGWFDGVLNGADRDNIRNNGVGALIGDGRLVAHWALDEATGQTAEGDSGTNITLYLQQNAPGAPPAISRGTAAILPSNATVDNNLFFANDINITTFNDIGGGEFERVDSDGTNALLADPLFVNVGTTAPERFELQDGSPAIFAASDGRNIGAWQYPPDVNVSATSVSVGEDDGPGQMTVSLSFSDIVPITVDYDSSDLTAEAGTDYDALSGTLTFAPGTTAAVIDLPITPDDVDEYDETFLVTLSNPVGATLVQSQGTVTIVDADEPPTVTISTEDDTIVEGTGGTVQASYELTLSDQETVKTITVATSTYPVTATPGADYIPSSVTTTFLPGDPKTKSVTVDVISDANHEPDEVFGVAIGAVSNVTKANDSVTTTILDDDNPPLLHITCHDEVLEGDTGTTDAVFTVTVDPPSGYTIDVYYETMDLNVLGVSENALASAGIDFTSTSGTLTIPPDTAAMTLTVPIIGDELDEYDEDFSVTLSNPINAVIGTPTSTMTIVDNDVPLFSVADSSAVEGNAVTFTISQSLVSVKTLEVKLITSVLLETEDLYSTDQAEPGIDYAAVNTTVTFAPGTTSRTVQVQTYEDELDEDNELFYAYLFSPAVSTTSETDPNIDDGTAVGTIIDDDVLPSLSIADVIVDEDAGTATLTVVLSEISGRDLAVSYSTADGPAKGSAVTADGIAEAGDDYVSTSGTLTVTAGQPSISFEVTILDDDVYEQPENFHVAFTNPLYATLANDAATVSIVDDEPTHTLVYFLNVRGKGLRDGAWAPVNNYRRAYLILDPTRGQATIVAWLRNQGEIFPLIQDWHDDSVVYSYPVDEETVGVVMASIVGTQNEGDDTTSYQARTLRSGQESSRDIGNGEEVSAPRTFFGTIQASATNLWPIEDTDEGAEDAFDVMDLDLRARLSLRETILFNRRGATHEEVVELLTHEMELTHSIELGAVETKIAYEPSGCVLLYNLATLIQERGNGERTGVRRRGYVIVDIAKREMALLIIHSTGADRYYELKYLHDSEAAFFQEFDDQFGRPFRIMGSVDSTATVGERPDEAIVRYWKGYAVTTRVVGPDKQINVALGLRGESFLLNRMPDGEDEQDTLKLSTDRLRLDLRQTRDINAAGESVAEVAERLAQRLEDLGYADGNSEEEY